MRFTTVVETSNAVAATSSRKEKVALLAECLAGLPEAETRAGVGFLAGEPRQRPLGVGWAMLRELPPPADEPSLEVTDVDAAFDHVAALSGSGSAAARRAAVDDLFGRATAPEQAFLRALITGEVRQGALRAVAADAIAAAFGMKQADVRRALMLLGDPGETAAIAREQGAEGLRAVELQVGRPVLPMLAGTAPDLAGALERILPAAVEWKLDGARIQVHRDGGDVGVYTRSLDDVTSRVPEIVEGVLALPVTSIVLDGDRPQQRDLALALLDRQPHGAGDDEHRDEQGEPGERRRDRDQRHSRLLELGMLGLAACAAAEYLRAAGDGAQARGVEARSGERADRVDASGMAGQPLRLGVGQEDRRLLRDRVSGDGRRPPPSPCGRPRWRRATAARRARCGNRRRPRRIARADARRSTRTASMPRCPIRGRRLPGRPAGPAPTRRRSPPGRRARRPAGR